MEAASSSSTSISNSSGRIEDSFSRRKRDYASRTKRDRSYIANKDCENMEFPDRKKTSVNRWSFKGRMKANILSWLIDSETIQENAEIYSSDEITKQMTNKGVIKREGILCACCNTLFTVANFNVHGGYWRCEKPYENIIIAKTKISLLYSMMEAWNKPEESFYHKSNIIEAESNVGDLYDDACVICADGGNLMCCDGCNSTYHPMCIGMKDIPEDAWYCPYCTCKFCAKPARGNDYLLTCPQCEKRCHWECYKKINHQEKDINIIPIAPFCEPRCNEVKEKLTNMIGKRNELDNEYSWTLLHRTDDEFRMYIEDTYLRTMCRSKLAVARRLMEECFETIQDRHTRIKTLPSIVYNCGANFGRVDFKGFYTVVLQKDDEIISVASLRIHGTKLAEMPFIATSEEYRGKGMCKKLTVAIESALCYLKVENLIIPSVTESISYWVDRYGFSRLDPLMNREIMLHNTVMFHDSVRLQKNLSQKQPARVHLHNTVMFNSSLLFLGL